MWGIMTLIKSRKSITTCSTGSQEKFLIYMSIKNGIHSLINNTLHFPDLFLACQPFDSYFDYCLCFVFVWKDTNSLLHSRSTFCLNNSFNTYNTNFELKKKSRKHLTATHTRSDERLGLSSSLSKTPALKLVDNHTKTYRTYKTGNVRTAKDNPDAQNS